MAFMQCQNYPKGFLYSCDCQHCGCTNYWHESISEGDSEELHLQPCEQCNRQLSSDSEDVIYCGRQYAGRYIAPGYLDCKFLPFLQFVISEIVHNGSMTLTNDD